MRRWDRRRAKQSSTHYGILEQSIIYSTKSAEYLHDYVYWTVDSTRRWTTAAMTATKLKTLLTHHIISLMHRANIWCYYAPCRLTFHHLRGIVSSDIHHSIAGYYPCTPITRNEATNIDILNCHKHTKNIVDINIILHTSQYSRSKQDHIQQSTLEVLEYRFYRIWSCDDGVYIGMLGYHWMIKVVIPWTSHNNKHNWICHRSAIKKGGKWWINTIGIYEGCIRRIATWKSA